MLLTFQEDPKTVRCMFADLSEKQLRTQFVKPYRRGKNILCGSEVVEVSRIKTVSIIRTADASDHELKRTQEKSWQDTERLNAGSKRVLFLNLGRGDHLEDIAEAGEDVTPTFIVGPPGHGDRWTVVTAVLNNPWIRTIGTGVIVGVIVAGLVWWLRWK